MIKYVKFSSERKEKYRIETSILEINGKNIIQKKAMNSKAIEHIFEIEKNYEILSKMYGEEHVAKCQRISEDTIWMEYIEAKSLSMILITLLKNKMFEQFYTLLDKYILFILKDYKICNEFSLNEINGIKRKYNLDLTFDNIFVKNDKFIITDYEWLVDKVDKDFVLYRALNGFCLRNSNIISDELKKSLLKMYKLEEKKMFYIEKERIFLSKVLDYNIERYKKRISNVFDIIENKNKEIENKNKEIENINNSRGYRVLKKYYTFRDKVLPVNSKRRKLIKYIISSKKKMKIVRTVINFENLRKGGVFLKRYGIKEFLIKLNNKINQIERKENLLEGKKEYLNYLLEKDNYIIDKNIIVDIIMPIYNAYEYTKKCIESIYKNTDMKYNLYLINDCSPDKRIKEILNNVSKRQKPINMEGLYIIENEKNLGFIKTVNKAIKVSKNHVVLLNTDTEVPNNWLSRLMLPILKDKKIASVTPFANSATICSFPNFCKDNNLPEGISLKDLDTIFYNFGSHRIIEIPTGVGFCMAMNRECISKIGELDIIYGKGYGEENDWCRRAVKYGYKNVMITNLFIYHKHGVSFSEQIDKSKQERINENLKILTKRYPDYIRFVDEFIIKDPVKNIRDFLYYIYLENKNSIKENGVLFINHSCGGGTKVYQDNLIAKWKSDKRIYLIELLSDLKTICFTIYRDEGNRSFYFNLKNMDEKQFCNLVKAFNIDYIYINQLVTYPLEKMINFIIATKIKYTFFVHDFYSVCPEYTLLNQDRVYCNAEKDIEKCNLCLKKQNNIICKDIKYWRIMFEKFLSKATEVIVPSESTAKIIKSYYPKLDIIIKEHDIPNYIHKTFKPEFLKKDVLNVAIIGAISENKGSNIVYNLVEDIRKEQLPINIKIIGITNLQSDYYRSKDGILEITGRYNNNEISDLLAKYQIGVVLIPSIWPETYSYTASEAIYSGYPIMVFDIGAPADRVRELNCGWILKKYDSKSVLNLLKNIKNTYGGKF